ncbi:hypothetical protein [Thiothrix fructosivorans]|uniref:Uncharacterized protein n=1 Tax=Thiothrix fructosivorans TaxID=111770 RepID=A0A8B0SNH6_9GAMM|nr:hypothetical protein [Thiothrix fructosivorans]MBO0612963.1 hypothetical protein [Thiothrix fructosivorans]QTX11588.1 hypothetical protein J1836_004335 [Thiothrix fructosivorans]
MKNNQFDNYSHDELEAQRRVITAGYLIITIASFLAMTFFVTHNMIGTSKPIWDAVNGLNWGFGQLAYLFISVGFAFGFNAFTYFFYQMELNAKQRAFVLFVAIAFPMFAEIGQSMTRAEDTRHEAATNSEAFKIMAGRVKNAGVTSDTGISSAMAAAMAEKAKAQTELAACSRYTVEARRQRCERIETGNIAAAQAKAEGFQMAGSASLTASSSQLKQDTGMLKELEADDGFLQPIVLLLVSFGMPAIVASFLIAFIIIGSMEVAMAYLGGLLRQLKDRMRALGIAVSSNKIKARYVDGVSYTREAPPALSGESAPMAAFAPLADSAKQGVAEFAKKFEQGLKSAPEIVATEYARADYANKQVLADAAAFAGKIGNKLDDALNAENRKNYPQKIQFPVGEGKTAEDYDLIPRTDKTPTLSGENTLAYLTPRLSVTDTVKQIQASVKASGASSPEAITAAVFDAFAAMPNPAPLSDAILERVAGKIIPTNERAHSSNEQIIGERNERTASDDTLIPTNERAHSFDAEKELLEAMKDAQGKVDADILKEGYGLYEQWKAAIVAREAKLTTRDGRSFVNAHLCQGKKRTITPEGMNALIVIWQARAAKEGVLLLNPKYTGKPPFPKYLLAA